MATALGFDDVVATRLDWSPGRQPSPPRLAGRNCYGREKLERFSQIGVSSAGFAYSDHVSDIDMLRMADHAIAVNPSRGLRRLARAGQATIANLNQDDISFLIAKTGSSE
jgi:phosphoserine phosphatase